MIKEFQILIKKNESRRRLFSFIWTFIELIETSLVAIKLTYQSAFRIWSLHDSVVTYQTSFHNRLSRLHYSMVRVFLGVGSQSHQTCGENDPFDLKSCFLATNIASFSIGVQISFWFLWLIADSFITENGFSLAFEWNKGYGFKTNDRASEEIRWNLKNITTRKSDLKQKEVRVDCFDAK